ncbi:MAG: hypothetical protein FJ088_04185 [Deltaproteobacteria bacterium]|nr:hypothetical protein [Deltaproteobacteria bacterium]
MRFTYSFPVLNNLNDEFYCRPRRKKLILDKCLDDFMNANAYENKRSVCWRCPIGRRNRENFSNS